MGEISSGCLLMGVTVVWFFAIMLEILITNLDIFFSIYGVVMQEVSNILVIFYMGIGMILPSLVGAVVSLGRFK